MELYSAVHTNLTNITNVFAINDLVSKTMEYLDDETLLTSRLLNKASNKIAIESKQDDTDLVNRLEVLITKALDIGSDDRRFTSYEIEIKNISQHLISKQSRVYFDRLPSIIHQISTKASNQSIHSETIIQIFKAIKIQTITRSTMGIQAFDHWDSEHKIESNLTLSHYLLIVASRALLHVYYPKEEINPPGTLYLFLNVNAIPRDPIIPIPLKLIHFPWLSGCIKKGSHVTNRKHIFMYHVVCSLVGERISSGEQEIEKIVKRGLWLYSFIEIFELLYHDYYYTANYEIKEEMLIKHKFIPWNLSELKRLKREYLRKCFELKDVMDIFPDDTGLLSGLFGPWDAKDKDFFTDLSRDYNTKWLLDLFEILPDICLTVKPTGYLKNIIMDTAYLHFKHGNKDQMSILIHILHTHIMFNQSYCDQLTLLDVWIPDQYDVVFKAECIAMIPNIRE